MRRNGIPKVSGRLERTVLQRLNNGDTLHFGTVLTPFSDAVRTQPIVQEMNNLLRGNFFETNSFTGPLAVFSIA